MDKNSDPLETIIDFAWSTGADIFWVNNAKDELKKLKKKSREETNKYLDLKKSLDHPAAYARITDDGVLYDFCIHNDQHDNLDKIISLYRLNNEKHSM